MDAATIRAQLDDAQALSVTLYGEARGEPIEGKVAVACVVRHRATHPTRWGRTVRGVCLQRAQFSCWWTFGGQANYQAVMALATALVTRQPLPISGRPLALFRECWWVSEGILSDQITDRVKGADHYYAPAAMVPRDRVPEWARGQEPVAIVGSHRFYRLA